MLFIAVFLARLMFLFVNALFYTVSLLILSFLVLTWIVSSNIMSTLIMILVVIVYVGAIIILIGYICAVRPNLITSPSLNYFGLAFMFLVFGFFLKDYSTFGFSEIQGTLLDFFFRDWGCLVFLLIVFILFFTLLIVTSQYRTPQGPFRSSY